MKTNLTRCLFVSATLGFAVSALGAISWMEGEKPDSATVAYTGHGWGNSFVLSEKGWLHISVDAGQVAEKIPEEGGLLRYKFSTDAAGPHEVWDRVGFEFVRSDFEWRVDDGEWANVTSEVYTQDLMLLADWCEVAWCPLGTVELAPGDHTLEIRLPRRYEDEARTKPKRVLYSSDALVVAPKGAFRPNGPHKPGTDWRTAEDKAAEAFRFELPEAPADGARAELSLSGRWQYARWLETEPIHSLKDMDEASRAATPKVLSGGGSILVRADGTPVVHRAGPIPVAPPADALDWSSIPVPGDRNHLRPDQDHAHRYFYRTRVFVPASYRGGSLFLDFRCANLLTSVFVNGDLVAVSSAAASGFHADISGAVRPGEVNEIWIGIKDAYYAIAPDNGGDLRRTFNLPIHFVGHNQGTSWKLDFPTANTTWNGLVDEVRLIATAGTAYADDVYVIPSVTDKRLSVEVNVPGGAPHAARVSVSAKVLDADGHAVLDLPAVALDTKPREADPSPAPGGGDLAAFGNAQAALNSVATLTAPWADAHLWSPNDPYLYDCVVTVSVDGRPADVSHTTFGFREWRVDGTHVTLNGVPWQMRAVLDYNSASADDVEKAFAHWRTSGQTMFRLMYQNGWGGLSRDRCLDPFDQYGLAVRADPGFFDGEVASYGLIEDETQADGSKKSVYKRDLFRNYARQVAAGVKRYRNHPSLFSWQLENEIVYINSRNFGWLDRVEPGIKEVSNMVLAMDRQGRITMVEGGRALKDQSLPVNGCHYEMTDLRHYPDASYSLDVWKTPTRSQPWPMAMDKPIFLNEEFFAVGNPVSYYAEVGGEACFLGRTACRNATALVTRLLSQGFRWQGLAGWHFWMDTGTANDSFWSDWQPCCALTREWSHTYAGGADVSRTIMVRNDNSFDASPIAFEWEFALEGARKPAARGNETLAVPCGDGLTTTIAWRVPKVDARTAATLTLRCVRGGKTVFEEKKPCAVFPTAAERLPRALRRTPVLFWGDAASPTLARLKALGLAPVVVDSLDAVADAADWRALVVDAGVLSARDATDPRWTPLVESGRRILVLEQAQTLHFQAIPADITATDHTGAFVFPQNPAHPAFRGLDADDFSLWAGDHHVYTNAFVQPTRGADSLIQCGPALGDCALAQCTPGDGLIVLSQLCIGTKLATEPVATILLDNLVSHLLTYAPLRRPVAVLLPDGPRLAAVSGCGLHFTRVQSAAEALEKAPGGIILCDGSRETLEAFRALGADTLDAFFQAGGWLVPWNVGPDGLASFNALAGTDYILRPFRREKVEIPVPRDPLLSGLSQRDVTLFSGERIFGWVSDRFVADDTFSGVVDTTEVAPFATGFGIPGPGRERESQTVVNGFTSSEAWRYIVYQELPSEDALADFEWKLARPETIRQVSIAPNGHYRGLHNVKLVFDDNEADARAFTFAPYGNDGGGRQDIDIDPPVRASKITLHALDLPAVHSSKNVTGIDNLWITVERDADWHARSIPLLNVGTLVKHPRGAGGILLNQLLFKENEEVPENGPKKLAILATLLRNLGGVFAAAREIRPGDRLQYAPVSLEGEGLANLYLSAEKGFPDKQDDLSRLPLGEQRMGGVLYHIRDFRTSPLESAVTLSGMPGIKAPDHVEIPVHAKADALFFLHALYPRDEWKPRNATDAPPAVWQYEIRYEDGETVAFPIAYGREVAPFKSAAEPTGLAGASLAWFADAPSGNGLHQMLYNAQWNNPNPDKPVASVTLRYAEPGNRYGAPILLGVTAATAVE